MAEPLQPRNAQRNLSREEVAAIEVGQTRVAPLVARLLIAAFLTTVISIPLLQFLYGYDRYRAERDLPDARRRHATPWPPPFTEFAAHFPEVSRAYRRSDGGLSRRVFAANEELLRGMDRFEERLDRESLPSQSLGGNVQEWLVDWGGVGNEQAYLGRDGWLFFRPDVDHVAGPGFLQPRHLKAGAADGNESSAPLERDPFAAILQFHRDLEARGIVLVLMPVPVKPTIHPERLSSRYSEARGPVRNASFADFGARLEQEGVLVLDVADDLFDDKARTSQPQFLETDTHWTPGAMQRAARRLAEFLRERAGLPQRERVDYRTEDMAVSNRGDIARVLRLPRPHPLNRMQKVPLRTIFDERGDRWQPDPTADVLLLGDSFTNIYSQAELRWGESAGLAEQLAFELGRPIDRIAINDDGAFSARRQLAAELERLQGKRAVVWQFAARELSAGDWKVIPLPAYSKVDD